MTRLPLFRSARALAGALLLLAAAAPRALGAQDRLVVRPEPGTPMVAMEVLIAAGPADESPEQAGLAYLTARAATRPIRPVLDSLGAHLTLLAHKDALGFTLLAAPDTWREASRILLVALFRDPADSVGTLRERAALRAELIGREASPADALAREVDAAVFGPEHPWRRPAAGYSVTVEKLTLPDVDGFLRAHLTPDRTVVAVVGPVDAAGAREHLAPFFSGAPWQPPRGAPPAPVESPVRREYNSITAWIAASYAFPADVDVEAVRLLGEMAAEGLSFGPSRRSVYNARSEVLRRAEGGELRIQIVVPPREVEAWAERIDEVVAQYAQRELPEARFSERVRRFRGVRLRELDTPEARAQAAAREAFLGRGASGRLVNLDDLDRERLLAAARALREPTLVVLGPFVDAPSGGL
jgi:predicted Zn-dependent peptidase